MSNTGFGDQIQIPMPRINKRVIIWGLVAWLLLAETAPLLLFQRAASVMLVVAAGGWLIFGMVFEDKLPDYLDTTVGHLYYDVDGLSFMPMVRVERGHAELCIYYQNRYENPVAAVIHLRPAGESFIIHDGWTDVHFAFRAGGGDFGVIHQPIHVPEHLRGEVISAHMAAASHYPRSHGARVRKDAGMPCGDLLVDWAGSAFKSGVHEVSGQIDLIKPVTIHLPMPSMEVTAEDFAETWRQEMIHAGSEA
jgi:hypothetical protein